MILSNLFSGFTSDILKETTSIIDDCFFTEEEKSKAKKSLADLKVKSNEIAYQAEKDLNKSYQAELETAKTIIQAETQHGGGFVKNARPMIIYSGLLLIFLEIFGLRHFIINQINPEFIGYSNSVVKMFLGSWAGVVAVYSAGRSFEKRGTANKIISAIVGNKSKKIKSTLDNLRNKGVYYN